MTKFANDKLGLDVDPGWPKRPPRPRRPTTDVFLMAKPRIKQVRAKFLDLLVVEIKNGVFLAGPRPSDGSPWPVDIFLKTSPAEVSSTTVTG